MISVDGGSEVASEMIKKITTVIFLGGRVGGSTTQITRVVVFRKDLSHVTRWITNLTVQASQNEAIEL